MKKPKKLEAVPYTKIDHNERQLASADMLDKNDINDSVDTYT